MRGCEQGHGSSWPTHLAHPLLDSAEPERFAFMVCQGLRAHNTRIFAMPLASSHGGKESCARECCKEEASRGTKRSYNEALYRRQQHLNVRGDDGMCLALRVRRYGGIQ
jgi:hypothetical protein